jgi:hypothetical protein
VRALIAHNTLHEIAAEIDRRLGQAFTEHPDTMAVFCAAPRCVVRLEVLVQFSAPEAPLATLRNATILPEGGADGDPEPSWL